jgi:uroporphyrinogen decarboxylase
MMSIDNLSSKERVLRAMNWQEPDRVPIDLSGTHASGITVGAYEKLKKHLGIERPTNYLSWRSQVVVPDEEVLKRFHIDTRILTVIAAEDTSASGASPSSYVDEWGAERTKLPDGHYYVSTPPLARDLGPADLERHKWPDPERPARYQGLRESALKLREETDCAIVFYLPARLMSLGEFLRGFDVWLMDLLINQPLAEALLAKFTEIQLVMIERYLSEVGELVDIVNVADDLGMQTGTLISRDLYRKMVKPWQRRIYDAIHARTPAKLLYHTCGSVYDLIPDFIEIGVDILNPVQVSARRMEPSRLKREFGRDICFWGGIDTHQVLPFGTPHEVRDEVRRRISELAPGGGYVLNAVHNIQREVPPENICAMFEAALEFGSLG